LDRRFIFSERSRGSCPGSIIGHLRERRTFSPALCSRLVGLFKGLTTNYPFWVFDPITAHHWQSLGRDSAIRRGPFNPSRHLPQPKDGAPLFSRDLLIRAPEKRCRPFDTDWDLTLFPPCLFLPYSPEKMTFLRTLYLSYAKMCVTFQRRLFAHRVEWSLLAEFRGSLFPTSLFSYSSPPGSCQAIYSLILRGSCSASNIFPGSLMKRRFSSLHPPFSSPPDHFRYSIPFLSLRHSVHLFPSRNHSKRSRLTSTSIPSSPSHLPHTPPSSSLFFHVPSPLFSHLPEALTLSTLFCATTSPLPFALFVYILCFSLPLPLPIPLSSSFPLSPHPPTHALLHPFCLLPITSRLPLFSLERFQPHFSFTFPSPHSPNP